MHLVGNVFLLDGFVQRGQAPERLLVVMGRILRHEVGSGTVQRLTVLWNRIRKIPDDGACLGIAERVATVVFHHHADDAARGIGFPVLAFRSLFLDVGQLVPPTELLDQQVIKLRVSGRDVSAF